MDGEWDCSVCCTCSFPYCEFERSHRCRALASVVGANVNVERNTASGAS